ncbi:alginate lyase family protein [Aestuariibaculum suncheonense]|uniref:Alginate lyase family protein n=1 Tax=Aestuariibaculum suncheonense TaxID=1028745 RepID=A0A8J6QIK3_9FLAO|nr:alginate lyase family protein [Aestuariibaculum suncheonense]MBD0835671.1 alginate lyase family protein [Aestuariibaculum suncheonense]
MSLDKYIIIAFYLAGTLFCYAQNDAIFDKIDFNLPQLSTVNKAFSKGNHQNALMELLNVYKKKANLYLSVSESDIDYIKANHPEGVEKSIKTANNVLNHYFLFRDDWDMEKTNVPYQFKGQIDWKAIPNGDVEWCYMLNRHKFWIDLGKAYLLTGDEKYSKEFVEQIIHWIDHNPLKDDLKHYTWRRIEAGIRCENWIKAFEYVKNSKYITPEFLEKFLESLYEHGVYLNSAFSGFSQTSNWGVLEFQGVYNLSLFLDDFKIATQWQKDAIEKLTTCITLQIMEDGTQWEQSPMYHNEVFHCYLNVNLLAQRKGLKLPEIIVKKTKAMAFANIKSQKPNYHQPLLGDSDDTDLRGLLTLAATLFNDSILKSKAYSELDYETLFLTGKDNNLVYKRVESKFPEFLSVYQQSSGDFYMRSSWKENATYSSFHLKKLGCGHGHDNLLHFTIFANGKDYLIDGGRYTYVDNEWREFFKNNKSHNTIGVDNLTNSVYNDSWTNSFEARSQGIYTKSAIGFDYAEAENNAYSRLEDPVTVKRRLLYLKPNIWLLFDSFNAKGHHKYSQYFNFPNNSVQITSGALTTTYKNDNLRIQPLKTVKMKLTDSWWSPEYNLKEPNKRAEIYKDTEGFTSFITLLYFPNKNNISFSKASVYNRKDVLLEDKDVEAITIVVENVEYTLVLVHNASAPANHFYKVNDTMVYGEVILIEKHKKEKNIIVLKE